MDSIGSTGWIFLGYYDDKIGKYIDRRYFILYKSAYSDSENAINIHRGDILQLTKDRRVIILGYKKTKDIHVLERPLTNLTNDDYTGVLLPNGTKVKVDDVSIAHYPNRPTRYGVEYE